MLKETLKNHHIILASGSPRRHDLFKSLNLKFERAMLGVVYTLCFPFHKTFKYRLTLKSFDLVLALLSSNLRHFLSFAGRQKISMYTRLHRSTAGRR